MTSQYDGLMLFLDWDETITSHDTLSLISPPDDQHLGVPFSEYGKAYMEDLKEHEKNWRFENDVFDTGGIEIPRKNANLGKGWEEQFAFQASVDDVELRSQKRIEEGKLFLNANPKELENRAKKHVQFRKGWKEFIKLQIPFHIISVGWSARFIQSALETHQSSSEVPILMPLTICANEIEIDPKTGLGTGKLTKSYDADRLSQNGSSSGGIRTGQHKVREMRKILKLSSKLPFTVYVGDSTTDLGCLVEANIGLIIGEKQSTLDSIKKAGLEKYLLTSPSQRVDRIKQQIQNNNQPCLITIKDWNDAIQIIETIQGLLSR